MTACAECRGTLSTGAKACAQCGHPVGPWGSCPECKAAITEAMTACKECGFPLQARTQAPPPPAQAASPPGRNTTRTRKRRKARSSPAALEEPGTAIVFAILGLFIPILAVFGLMQSRRGSAAHLLSWIGIALWVATAVLIVSLVVRRVA